MRRIKDLLLGGLASIGVGTIWYILVANGKADYHSLLFWTVAAFVIGIIFNIASLIFQIDKWSLKKQVAVNFFVLFAAWVIFNMLVLNFDLSLKNWIYISVSFIIMYAIGYGSYLFNLRKDIKQINQKLS